MVEVLLELDPENLKPHHREEPEEEEQDDGGTKEEKPRGVGKEKDGPWWKKPFVECLALAQMDDPNFVEKLDCLCP